LPNITARGTAGGELGCNETGLPPATSGAVTVRALITHSMRALDASGGLSVRVSDAVLAPDASEPSPPWVAAQPVVSSASEATNGTMTLRFTLMTQRPREPKRFSVGG